MLKILRTQQRTPLEVYWTNSEGNIVYTAYSHSVPNTYGWGSAKLAMPSVMPGAQFAVVKWDNGNYIRLYHYSMNNSVHVVCRDEGQDWYSDTTIV